MRLLEFMHSLLMGSHKSFLCLHGAYFLSQSCGETAHHVWVGVKNLLLRPVIILTLSGSGGQKGPVPCFLLLMLGEDYSLGAVYYVDNISVNAAV
ncbi:hypothetical protein CRG98_037846 [Punica granatum]|uniref:Uncharacterized protein n=1 Tax=Punica granatum TaxID=22663 RepID=A0A2I0ICQ9_PUNGR|nr:hypothetical protein CRG98_037846 [Punica granatum]